MRYLLRILAIIAALTLVGVFGFRLIEGWPWIDCVYMTVITLTTVGFREVEPLSESGKLFITIYLCAGLGVFMFALIELGQLLVSGVVREWMEKRSMEKVRKAMADHHIVCGFGRMGGTVCSELLEREVSVLVVDNDEQALEQCRERSLPFVHGDATEDRTLLNAGIETARGLVAALPSEADNLYAVLSARLLRKDILIVAKALSDEGAAKLKRAGADRVVNLYASSATKMTQWLVNPNVQDFIELVTNRGPELDITELAVSEASPFAGTTLGETDLRERGIMVVAIRKRGGDLVAAPEAGVRIDAGDSLLALAKSDAMTEFLQEGT